MDEVVRAIARANKWVVAPAGDAALDALGLDTQVLVVGVTFQPGQVSALEEAERSGLLRQ
ncbi:hypothetical protein [Rubneribacter sp.]